MASISATTAAIIASTVVAAAATSVSAYSAVAAGENAKETADYNAEMQRRAAHDAVVRGEIEASEKRQQAKRIIATQTAGFAANGVNINSGSPLDVLTETAGMGELDALRTLNNAQRHASGLTANADLVQAQGKQQQTAGYYNAAGTALSGLSSMGMAYYGAKNGTGTPSKPAPTVTAKA